MMDEFSLCPADPDQWEEICALEAASYPADEAATPEKIRYRLTSAADYFQVLRNGKGSGELVGFINGTCTSHATIHHDSMSTHEPAGRTLVIHSVVVSPAYRRKKIAVHMMKSYLQVMHQRKLCDRVLLLSKSYLLPLYLQCGFQVHCLSPVVHGEDNWFELGLQLRSHFGQEQLQVDAFTTGRSFSGNPAAVVFVHGDDQWMQNVAMENNLAETSFLEKIGDGNYKLRWFTPNKEVELCGHATLAAVHALYETGRESRGAVISFHSVYSGILLATGHADGSITLEFPATPPAAQDYSAEQREWLTSALHIDESDVLFTGRSLYDAFVEITPQAFNSLNQIDYSTLARFGGRGVIVTSAGGGQDEVSARCDFRSRCFFPVYAINEDPVTGSAHCALAPYWFEKLATEKAELLALQASPRGGLLRLSLSEGGGRVLLTGHCQTTMTMRILS